MRSRGPSLDLTERRARRRPLAQLVLPLAAVVALAGVAVVVLGLWQSREDGLTSAEQATRNVANGVAADLARSLHLYDGLLRTVAAESGPVLAGGGAEALRRLDLPGRLALMPEPGDVTLVGAQGTVIASSTPAAVRQACCGDDPAFTVQRDEPATGLYVSGPVFSVTAPTDARLVLSRRIAGEDGRFAGVAIATVRISHIRDLLRVDDTGTGGSLTVLTADGTTVAREPSADGAGDVMRQMPLPADPARAGGNAVVVGTSPIDGIERLSVQTRVGDLPLWVVAGVPLSEIHKAANDRAIIIGGGALVLAGIFFALAIAFRSESVHREAAETLLEELAITDPLTNLANGRRFEEVLGTEWRRGLRNRMPMAVLVVEVDRFSAVSERYGRATADGVLRAVGRVIAQAIRRPGDLAARPGGAEFMIVLPDTAAEGALLLAERMRARAEEIDAGVKLKPLKVTVTVGVGWGYPSRDHEPEMLVVAAEKALEEARSAGRNRAARVDLGQPGFILARPTGTEASAA